jgi:hypothetical protein
MADQVGAGSTFKSSRTATHVVIDLIHASSIVSTRCCGAIIDVDHACATRIAYSALTAKGQDSMRTICAIGTRSGSTFVDVYADLTRASVTRGTKARVRTSSSMLAQCVCRAIVRSIRAWIHYICAGATSPARSARTTVRSDPVDARAPMYTWTRGTLIDVIVAVGTIPAGDTGAGVCIDAVSACAVHTRYRGTLVDIIVAVGAVPASDTGAGVCIDAVSACAVHTRYRGTFVDVGSTVKTHKTSSTRACVKCKAIGTCATVRAWRGTTLVYV